MTEVLSALAGLTLGGSAAVALLALLGRSKYRVRWRCWTWAVLCVRLLLPLSATARSETALQPPIQLPAVTDRVVYQSAPAQSGAVPSGPAVSAPPGPVIQAPPRTEAAASVPAPASAVGFSLSLSQVLAGLWLAGIAVVLCRAGISHLKFLRYLRRWAGPVCDPETVQLFRRTADLLELRCTPELRVCPDLPAPMLAGLFHPVLLLPADLEGEQQLRFALLHELTHFRRKDIILKTLALTANAVHWFNPLMWYMTRLVERDLELACDEDILNRLDAREYAAYGRAILSAAERPARY